MASMGLSELTSSVTTAPGGAVEEVVTEEAPLVVVNRVVLETDDSVIDEVGRELLVDAVLESVELLVDEVEEELVVKLVEKLLGTEELVVLSPAELTLLLLEVDEAAKVVEVDDVVESPIGLRLLLMLVEDAVVAVLLSEPLLLEVDMLDDGEVEPPIGPPPSRLLVIDVEDDKELLGFGPVYP
jgi:hypothetical protein